MNKKIVIMSVFLLTLPSLFNAAEVVEANETSSNLKQPRGDGSHDVIMNSDPNLPDQNHDIILNSDSNLPKTPLEIARNLDAKLYATVNAEDSITNNEVCIYVKSDNSEVYKNSLNKERKLWSQDPVAVSTDLEEGAMLRAGENVLRYATGAQKDIISHESEKYGLEDLDVDGFVAENLAYSTTAYNPSLAYNSYYKEKEYLPESYDPNDYLEGKETGIDNQVIGHYTTMINPQIAYVGQGAALADENCDGNIEYTVYANEHSQTSKDLYPDLAVEISRNHGGEGLSDVDDIAVNDNENVQEEDTTGNEDMQEENVTNSQENTTDVMEEEVVEQTDDLINTASTSFFEILSIALLGLFMYPFYKAKK